MRIAVIGAGNVGGTLGRRWAELGHEVVFGLRNPDKGAAGVKGGGALPARASVASPPDAVRGADVVVLATPWGAVNDALREVGSLDGRILLDTTNPVAAGLKLDVGPNGESAAERIQAMVPGAKIVKVFNTTGFNNMQNPSYGGAPTMMCYAGDDAAAKSVAHELATAIGFDAIDAGALVQTRHLEHLAALWIGLAYGAAGAPPLGREFAFRLVRR
jgi:predicted dinucleotide-binding enzyme